MQVGETSKDGKNAYLACSASKLHNPFCSVLDLDLENCLDLHLSMMTCFSYVRWSSSIMTSLQTTISSLQIADCCSLPFYDENYKLCLVLANTSRD